MIWIEVTDYEDGVSVLLSAAQIEGVVDVPGSEGCGITLVSGRRLHVAELYEVMRGMLAMTGHVTVRGDWQRQQNFNVAVKRMDDDALQS